MILGDFLKALGQIGDRRFLAVLIRGVALAFALLAGAYGVVSRLVAWFVPATIHLPWIGDVTWLHDLAGWGSLVAMLVLSVFLMVPVASAFTGIFLDDVAEAVEARHYPRLPPAPTVRFSETMRDTVGFLGTLLAVNAVALVFYQITVSSDPVAVVAGARCVDAEAV